MSDDPVKVLIVDDDDVDREMIRRRLTGSFQVSEAATASEVMERLAAEKPQCVILDYLLPDGSGLETLAKVVAGHPDVAVVMLTGQGDETIAVQAIRGGAHDYLVKDDLGGLTDAVRTAIRRKAVEQALHFQREQAVEQTGAGSAFWVTSADGRLVEYASMGYESLWGRPVQRLYDDPDDWLAAVEGERRDSIRATPPGSLRQVQETDYEIRTPAGEIRLILDRTIPIRDQQDRLCRVLRSVRDVTADRRVERQLIEALSGGERDGDGPFVVEVSVANLQTGMVLIEEVLAENGLRLVAAGQEVTTVLRSRLWNFAQSIGVVEPLHVITRPHSAGIASGTAARTYRRA